jgi:hypothetical protein
MIVIDDWRIDGISASMRDHFLGCSSRLRDINYIEIPERQSGAINKFGMKSESSG